MACRSGHDRVAAAARPCGCRQAGPSRAALHVRWCALLTRAEEPSGHAAPGRMHISSSRCARLRCNSLQRRAHPSLRASASAPASAAHRGSPHSHELIVSRLAHARCAAGAQLGDLPAYDAQALGGVNSVRGWAEGALGSARHWAAGHAELELPLAQARTPPLPCLAPGPVCARITQRCAFRMQGLGGTKAAIVTTALPVSMSDVLMRSVPCPPCAQPSHSHALPACRTRRVGSSSSMPAATSTAARRSWATPRARAASLATAWATAPACACARPWA